MKKQSKSNKHFSKLATKLKKEGADDPKALAAYIGRKKLGKEVLYGDEAIATVASGARSSSSDETVSDKASSSRDLRTPEVPWPHRAVGSA